MNPGLPAGERVAAMQVSPARLLDLIPGFTGYVKAEKEEGEGFLLVEKGKPIAAGFLSGEENFTGEEAFETMMKEESLNCTLNMYSFAELEEAKAEILESFGIKEEASEEEEVRGKSILSAETLQSVMRQPGVRAVSVIYEGFALQSVGDADFEHVAAVAEDLVRAGQKMTGDLMMGSLDQMLLETLEGKLIVAPVKELYICVLAETNANLGLIRLSLQSLKYDTADSDE
ncbi:MAG: roadblock/LC7 domain-containing protein [Methanomicrobium sp.]|nr:roadblock/LC7 domain-containing protein [Methanomicrobium sp.]MDD4299435.1 roadblock/LC7 domain-containing protein [Methanomicrobium sp.]